ncbi:MAG: competence/damage-inducible protein A [Acidobacteria bacterium]|nr:competence/damage-inducible protein A [Acidobacteriota bacterium]
MKACILAVGSEMLTPFRVDTNSLFITERLNEIGYDVRMKAVVADDLDELARVIEAALTWADLVVTTGGLGPTEDDLTREAVARVLRVPSDINEEVLERLRARFARRGIAMPENNRRQAMVPRGAAMLDNPNGTAPGLWVERGNAAIVVLPGPPREMQPMLEAVIRDRIASASGGARLFRRVVRLTGRAESEVDARAQPIYSRWTSQVPPITTTILAVMGHIELHLTVQASDRSAAQAALDSAVEELLGAFGRAVYSTDGRTLETVVGDLLRARGMTIAVAESCTGGLLASRLTDVPGSSDYVERGAVCYSNRAKVEMLGVPADLIEAHGAVSGPVARAMAEGIRARAGVNVAVAVTGIAGPSGGSAQKPVGTVFIAAIADDQVRARAFQFLGGRDLVKFQAAQSALNMVRLMLLGVEGGREWAERI